MLLTEHRADRVVLYNISWQKFENLLVDLGESRSARVAYDDGTLEILTPLPEHEYYKEIIGDIIRYDLSHSAQVGEHSITVSVYLSQPMYH
jgi:Uma2 family endonuclease